MKTLKIWIWVSVAVMIILVLLYFIQFHGKLSDDKTDWGTFGDYLSGVFAVFNLAVVVLLTLYVSNNDKKRSVRELEVQRRITLSQFRYSEFNRIDNEFLELLNLNRIEKIEERLNRIEEIEMYFFSFSNDSEYLFPIVTDRVCKDAIAQINSFILSLIEDVKLCNRTSPVLFHIGRHNLKRAIQEYIISEMTK